MAKGFGPLIVRQHEVREVKILRRSVMQHFQQIKDPRVDRTRQLWNKTTTEVCFYISSLEADAARHNQVIRSHWSVENSLHWGGVSAGEASPAEPPLLDVTFNEDASRISSGYAPENLGLLRRLSVNLLKREPSKLSLAMKRYKAGLENEFLLKILAASASS